MAVLPVPVNPTFPDVYQIETRDRVLGGAEGIANLQAKQLAERDAYLKDELEATSNAQDAHANAADPHPQYIRDGAVDSKIAAGLASLSGVPPTVLNTLAKLAAAINNDPVFFQTITNSLASKAPLHSPNFSGSPTAATPSAGDNSTRVSTTEYVRAEIAALLASAPAALDTLNELATALGNDPNFATTINNALAAKLNSSAYTAADVLTKIKSVDGAGSGLDADLLDGRDSTYFRHLNIGATDQDPNEVTDPVILTNHANSPSSLFYWHITTTFYSSISNTANRGQIAVKYNGTPHEVYSRHHYAGSEGWTPWARLWTDANDGAGSGLDADLLDGLQSGYNGNNVVLRTDSAGALLLDNWLRVSNTAGLISPDGGKLFRDGAYWALLGNSTAATSINLRTSDNVSRAHFYAISNDFGILNGAGSWSLRYESVAAAWRSYAANGFVTDGWFRSEGATGWINRTHNGGIHMRDTDAVRVYGGKHFTLESGTRIGLAHNYSGGIGPYIRSGDNWNVRLGSDMWGYVDIGPVNGSYCHYSTNLSGGHWFNTPVLAQGGFQQYSTRRRKCGIADLQYGVDALMQLKPVSFRYTEKPDRVHLGFIAEDVAEIISEPIIFDKDGLPETMDYDQLLAVIVSGVQQFAQQTNATMEQLTTRIAALEAERA